MLNGGIQMHNIAYRQAKRESECSYRDCEWVLFVVGSDKGLFENRRLTGLIRFVFKVLQKVESWWYTGGSWMQRTQVHSRDSDVTETDSEDKADHVDKRVDVPG
jgi:hypothetical protein